MRVGANEPSHGKSEENKSEENRGQASVVLWE